MVRTFSGSYPPEVSRRGHAALRPGYYHACSKRETFTRYFNYLCCNLSRSERQIFARSVSSCPARSNRYDHGDQLGGQRSALAARLMAAREQHAPGQQHDLSACRLPDPRHQIRARAQLIVLDPADGAAVLTICPNFFMLKPWRSRHTASGCAAPSPETAQRRSSRSGFGSSISRPS
jgi:hypothetical protein